MANPGPNVAGNSNLITTPKSPDGYRVGQTAADLVGFHNATPTAQVAAITAVATTAATSTTPFGFAEAQANALVSQLNLVIAALKTKGILA